MVSGKLLAASFLCLCVCGTLKAQEGARHRQLSAEEFQQYLRPASTRADTRLAHSSASDGFRPSRRRLLASSQTSAQAENGQGVIEYRPVGFNIDGDDFAIFFARAFANKRCSGIRLGSGTYHVTASIQEQNHLYMRCSGEREGGFEIDFTGVFFYFTDYKFGGVVLKNCTNVDLHGPYEQTYTNDQLDYVQGTIVGVNEDALEYTIEVDEGYPAERIVMHAEISVILWYGDTLLVKPQPYTIMDNAGTEYRKKLGDRRYSFKTFGFTPNVTVGNYLTIQGGSGTTGLVFDLAKNCSARDVTIYHTGGFGVSEGRSQNCSFINMQIRPFPNPLGRDGKLPLLSSSWDGIHISNAHSGTLIKNSYIVNTGDDAIATHGTYYFVASVDAGQKKVILATQWEFAVQPGDLLNLYAVDSERLASATIVKLSSVEQPKETAGKSSDVGGHIKYDEADFIKVQLDAWPEKLNRLRFNDLVSSPNRSGSGFAFVNNTVGNLRGRGMLCKSSNGVIAHNRFFNLMGFALQLAPELYWGESDSVDNVLVVNNTINSYGPGMWLGFSAMSGWEPPSPYTNNYNVDFINNTIANCETTPFLLTSAAGVTIANNTFVNVLCTDSTVHNFGDWEVKGSLLMVANVRDVTFSGNAVVKNELCKHPHGNYDHPVSMVNATLVTGLVPRVLVSSLLQEGTP